MGWPTLFSSCRHSTSSRKRSARRRCQTGARHPCRATVAPQLSRHHTCIILVQVSRALAKYRDNFVEDMRNSWAVWIPGHVVTYGLMPPAFRLPWMSFLSFGYVGLLSLTRGTVMEASQPDVFLGSHGTLPPGGPPPRSVPAQGPRPVVHPVAGSKVPTERFEEASVRSASSRKSAHGALVRRDTEEPKGPPGRINS